MWRVTKKGAVLTGAWFFVLILIAIILCAFFNFPVILIFALIILSLLYVFNSLTITISIKNNGLYINRGLFFIINKKINIKNISATHIIKTPIGRFFSICIFVISAVGTTSIICGLNYKDALQIQQLVQNEVKK